MAETADLRRSVVVLALAITQVASAAVVPRLISDVGSIAHRFDHSLLPADWAFGVWGLLYLTSLLAALWQVFGAQRRRAVHRRTGWPLAVAYGASTAWVPLFVLGQVAVAEVLLLVAVVALVRAALRLTLSPAPGGAECLLLRLPVTLYLGWAGPAAVAGLLTALRSLGLPASDEAGWVDPLATGCLAVVGLGCVVLALRLTALLGFVLTTCWALVAIAVTESATTGTQLTAVITLTLVLAILVLRIARTRHRRRVLFG